MDEATDCISGHHLQCDPSSAPWEVAVKTAGLPRLPEVTAGDSLRAGQLSQGDQAAQEE